MSLSLAMQQRLAFIVLCTVWGTNWMVMKLGVAVVPPGFFSGTRWTAAGLVLVLWRMLRREPVRVPRRLIGRLALVAVLMIAVNATIQLYGLRHVGSGLAAVITCGLTPVALLGFSVALGQERFSATQGVAIAVGLAGILLLFGPGALSGRMSGPEILGAAGVMAGCIAYCAGSVLARPLMRSLPPAQVAAATNLIGGLILLVLSLLFEPGAREAASWNWGGVAWAAWWYLLLPGSLGATIIYFLLVRDWGASRAGTYAFVSPIIAVLLGVGLMGERLQPTDALGMVLMLVAAGIVLRRV